MQSAGISLYRFAADGTVQVLIAHMGGPFWARKDAGAWSIPKGEYDDSEDAHGAARREFEEELGSRPPDGPSTDLGSVTQSNGKVVRAWAIEGELDVNTLVSNTFTMEWPRGSGRMQDFPEVDRSEWVDVETARVRLVSAQQAFLDRLLAALAE